MIGITVYTLKLWAPVLSLLIEGLPAWQFYGTG